MPSSHYAIALTIIKIAVRFIVTQLFKYFCALQLSLSLKMQLYTTMCSVVQRTCVGVSSTATVCP